MTMLEGREHTTENCFKHWDGAHLDIVLET